MIRLAASKDSALSNRIWSLVFALVPAAVAIGFLAFCWIERMEIFSRLPYSVVDSDNYVPYAWGLVACGLLAIQLRAATGPRLVRSVRLGLTIATAIAFLAIVAGKSSWVRYQVYRWETNHQHFGITGRSRDDTISELVDQLTENRIGQWLHRDPEMLRYLATDRGGLFARKPCKANLALTSLVNHGAELDEIESTSEGAEFLLYALAGDVFKVTDERFAWISASHQPDANEATSVIPSSFAENLIRARIESIDSLSDNELEALVFCVGNFVSLIDTKQRERVRASWLERVPEFESLLGEGYGLGEAIHESLPGDLPVTIQYSVNEGYALPVVAKRKQILLALPRSLQTCIGLCGDTPTTVSQVDDDEQLDEPNSANVRIKLAVAGDALRQYQRQVFEWRKKFKPGTIRTGSGYPGRYRKGQWVDERVATGKMRTETVFGATIQLTASLSPTALETSETLAYWQDYLRDNKETSDLESLDYRQLNGRMWPLGIHESYFRGADAFADRSTE